MCPNQLDSDSGDCESLDVSKLETIDSGGKDHQTFGGTYMLDVSNTGGVVKEFKAIPVNQIKANKIALRPVELENPEFQDLCASVKVDGVLKPILVIQGVNDESGNPTYRLIDGLQRFTAAQQVGIDTLVCGVVDASTSEGKILKLQMVANVQKVETKPAQYSQHIRRMYQLNPLLTSTELANDLGKSVGFINQRLSLGSLIQQAGELVDSDKITLMNAYSLAKLPADEQKVFLVDAQTLPPGEFIPKVSARVKELATAKRQGREAAPLGFVAIPTMRKPNEIKEEFAKRQVASRICDAAGATDAIGGFNAAIDWLLHMDAASLAEQKAKYEALEAEKAAKKARREAEQAEKKAKEAVDAA